jgi:LysR family hydrogen peroxide-inducible transcriptional activator
MSTNLHFNLRMLNYLVALADHGHFGRAADACFVTQPTLSTQIKKLEEQLGVTLVERHAKGAKLTETGEVIVRHARGLLQEAQGISEIAAMHQDPLAGRISIGIIPTLAPYLLPSAAPALHDAFPKLDCYYIEEQTDKLVAGIAGGDVDLGVLALPLDVPNCEIRELFDEPFELAVSADHPLAGRDRVSVDDLRGELFLLLEDGHCLRDQALEVCSLAGVVNEDEFRATSLETLRQMVAGGTGVTLLPELAIRQSSVGASRLRTIPFDAPAPSRRIVGVWRRSHPRGEVLGSVCDAIAAAVPELREAG